MKISKTIVALASPPPATKERDGRAIANAIAAASRGMGLGTLVVGTEDIHTVYCDGRPGPNGKPILEIRFVIHRFGDMEGYISRGLERGEGAIRVMRQILSNAVRTDGIVAVPNDRAVDPTATVDPNYYASFARQSAAKVPEAK